MNPKFALSIRQPWAWLILNAGKGIENRDWLTRIRGPIYLHASKGMTKDEYEDGADTLRHIRGSEIVLPHFDALERGGIVGRVDIVDCVCAHDSPQFFGEYGFVLANPMTLPFRPYRGALGFFKAELPT